MFDIYVIVKLLVIVLVVNRLNSYQLIKIKKSYPDPYSLEVELYALKL